MAKDVQVRLLANTTQYKAAMADAGRSTQMFAAGANTSTAGVSKGIGRMSGAAGLGSLALGAVAIEAGKMTLDFETAFAKIEGLVGTTGDELEVMKGHVLSLSGETAKAPQELADAMYFIASSGLEGQRALDALSASARASAAGLGDTAVVADAVTSAMNAYAESGLTASDATDILVATVAQGKGEPEELASSLGKVIPIAAEMGVEFHEVAGALAAMSLAGIDADEGTTALRGMLTGLLSPSAETVDALESIGLSAEDAQRSLAEDGLLKTLRMLEERITATGGGMEDLFPNVRALAGVMNILGGDTEAVNTIFEEVEQSTGDTDKAFGVMADTLEFKLTGAFSKFKANAISELGEVGDAVNWFLEDLEDADNRSGGALSGGAKWWWDEASPVAWMKRTADSWTYLGDKVGLAGDSVDDVSLGFISHETAARGAASGGRALADSADETADALDEEADAADAAAESAARIEQKSADAAAAMDEWAGFVDALTESHQRLVDTALNNLDGMFDTEAQILKLDAAYLDYLDSVDATNEILADSESTDREKAQSLLDLRTEQLDLTDAVYAAVDAHAQEKGALQGSKEWADEMAVGLATATLQYPELREEIDMLIGALNGIPENISSSVNITTYYKQIGSPSNNTTNWNPGGPRTKGGPVSGGMFYDFVENGPELLTVGGKTTLVMPPGMSGHVTPLAGSGGGSSMGGGGDVNINGVVIHTSGDPQATYDGFLNMLRRQGPEPARRALGIS